MKRANGQTGLTDKTKIILALDVDNFKKARYFVNKLFPRIKIFKVGYPLFTAAGLRIIEFIHKKGAGVFLDLKFFDIPYTVSNAIRQAIRLKVEMLTLHILGGEEMLKRAVLTAKEEAQRLKIKRPKLFGVTILTSKEADKKKILALAKKGINCGLDGVVCSVREAPYLRKEIKKKFFIVSPGIRLNKIAADDQKRTATAIEAIKAGSDFLVIGRPILEAKNPLQALEGLL
jgi:orotidine-5'-phosphate decarboxylase